MSEQTEVVAADVAEDEQERVCETCGAERDIGPHQLCVWCVSQALMDAQGS